MTKGAIATKAAAIKKATVKKQYATMIKKRAAKVAAFYSRSSYIYPKFGRAFKSSLSLKSKLFTPFKIRALINMPNIDITSWPHIVMWRYANDYFYFNTVDDAKLFKSTWCVANKGNEKKFPYVVYIDNSAGNASDILGMVSWCEQNLGLRINNSKENNLWKFNVTLSNRYGNRIRFMFKEKSDQVMFDFVWK